MVKLRPLVETDVLKLDRLWREHWSDSSLPNLNNRVIDAVAEKDDRVLGYGQVRLFAEAMLFVDPTARRRDRAQAVKGLMLEAFRGADQAGLEELYCFIKDPDFALLIEKHYDFHRVTEPGELLLRRL